MRSGLACNDSDGASQGNEEKMYGAQDWVRFWLDLPSPNLPDTVTSYCTGNPVALGHVLANATRQPVTAFAQARLFGPLGITSARWNMYDNGTQTDTGGHLHMRPRDMLRIGRLALQGGAWNGTQVVSAAWIAESTRQHTHFGAGNFRGYGYLWWHGTVAWQGRDLDMFFADGAGGQYIFVVPELDLAAVFTGENYAVDSRAIAPIRVMEAFIVGAVQP
jgi:CubicO group peptidase (beta-lactamase class C family)